MKRYEPPLWVEVKQSNYLLAFIISVHSLAILSTLWLAVILAYKAIMLMLVCYSLYFHWQRYQQGFYQFTLKHTDEFAWELGRNTTITRIRILNSSVLTSFIIILHVKIDGKNHSLLVCKDAVSAEAYRQLFVTLKIVATND